MPERRAGHPTRHPTAWFALGVFAIEGVGTSTTNWRNLVLWPPEYIVASWALLASIVAAIFAGWITIRRRRRPQPGVPFVLPLLLGLLQFLPVMLATALDDLLKASPIAPFVVLAGAFLGPILAAEVMVQWGKAPRCPLSPPGSPT